MTNKIVSAALSAMVAIGFNTYANAADKQDGKSQKTMEGMEKCYGIAKAGKNDCANNAGACPGQSKIDGDKKAWIALPKGTCEKIVGGSTESQS